MREIKITDVRQVPADSAFLIDDGKTSILYDTGFGFTGYGVAKRIKTYLGDRKLDYIFLTHSHYDHVLGVPYVLKYWPDAKVVAGEYAAKIFSKPTAKALMRDLDRKFAKTCGVDDYEDLVDGLKVDITATDGDVIKTGDMTFKVINLPGHTKCSVGFYCEERKLLLSNESIGVYYGKNKVMPLYLVGYQMALDSISKAEQLDIENILAPHYGLLDKAQSKEYLATARLCAKELAESIKEMLLSGKSKDEILEYFKEKFYHGYVNIIYPVDALETNTRITINLIEKELL